MMALTLLGLLVLGAVLVVAVEWLAPRRYAAPAAMVMLALLAAVLLAVYGPVTVSVLAGRAAPERTDGPAWVPVLGALAGVLLLVALVVVMAVGGIQRRSTSSESGSETPLVQYRRRFLPPYGRYGEQDGNNDVPP